MSKEVSVEEIMGEYLARGGTIKICKPMKAKGSDTFKLAGWRATRGKGPKIWNKRLKDDFIR